MKQRQTGPFAMVIVVGALTCACHRAPVVEVPTRPPPEDVVVLLTDADGTVGRAVVSSPSGAVDLGISGASTRISGTQAPSAVSVMTDSDVQQIFGDALSALPSPPLRFTFYFEFETEELTKESRASVATILQAVRDYPASEVIVIGHTDTRGSAPQNVDLGLKRANTVRRLLMAAQVDASAIEVSSRGEADPAITTADDVVEPRNRRVEITVR